MNPRHRTTHRSVSIVTTALVAVLAAGCGTDDGASRPPLVAGVTVDPNADTTPEDQVDLLVAGDGERVELPIEFEVGDEARTSLGLDIAIELDGRREHAGFEMHYEQRITEVTPEGAVVELIVHEVGETGVAADDPDVTGGVDDIVGVALIADVDPAGMTVGEPRRADGEPVPDWLTDNLAQAGADIDFPSEPVGVGAIWTSIARVEAAGRDVDVTTRFDLVEVTADRYVVEFEQRVPIDERVEGTRIEGSLTGTGAITGDRSNPLDVEITYDQVSEITADGFEMAVDLTTRLAAA